MDDREILDLFLKRSENAIIEAEKRYGNYCFSIAMRILGSEEDAKESVNDTFLNVWNNIPPKEPQNLGAYIGMICRSRSLDMKKSKTREKRGGTSSDAALDELYEIVPSDSENPADIISLRDSINSFLGSLPQKKRVVFLRRYFWYMSVSEIAASLGTSESSVKMTLSRTRDALKNHLIKEGFEI